MSQQRQKQLEKQGRSRKIIHALAQNSLTRAKFRRYLQQHVVGLRKAVKDNFIIGPDDEKCLIETINNLNESVKGRMDSLEQAAKEILQIVFRINMYPFSLCMCANVSLLSRSLPGCQSVKPQV